MNAAIFKKIKLFLKKHPRLDYIQKVILQANNPDFVEMVLHSLDDCTIQIQYGSDGAPDVIVWPIKLPDAACGLFALIEFSLNLLAFPDKMNFAPVVVFPDRSLYSEEELFLGTFNAFEYYFEPVANIRSDELNQYPGFVSKVMNNFRFTGVNFDYFLDEKKLSLLSGLYAKYLRLNSHTKELIGSASGELLKGKRTLAVHVRGTDFRHGYVGHPCAVPTEEYIKTVENVILEHAFDQVFLATDEHATVDAFIERFGDRLVYYGDTFRSSDGQPVHTSDAPREHHRYLLGLEALRDMLTIVDCDGLVCGLSRLSNCARIAKHARGEAFAPLIAMNQKMVETGPVCQYGRSTKKSPV